MAHRTRVTKSPTGLWWWECTTCQQCGYSNRFDPILKGANRHTWTRRRAEKRKPWTVPWRRDEAPACD